MSAQSAQQQNTKSYWTALEQRQKAEKTARTLTPAEVQKIIDASYLDPTLLDKIPEVRELRAALGQAQADIAASNENSWLNENLVSAYGNYARFNQKLGVGVDMLAKASVNRLFVSTRTIKGAAQLASRKQGLTAAQIFLIIVGVMLVGAIFFIPSNTTGFWSFFSASYYGIPNSWALIGLLGAFAYFVFVRPNRRQD